MSGYVLLCAFLVASVFQDSEGVGIGLWIPPTKGRRENRYEPVNKVKMQVNVLVVQTIRNNDDKTQSLINIHIWPLNLGNSVLL